jgi:hypothetical protein
MYRREYRAYLKRALYVQVVGFLIIGINNAVYCMTETETNVNCVLFVILICTCLFIYIHLHSTISYLFLCIYSRTLLRSLSRDERIRDSLSRKLIKSNRILGL